MVMAAPRPFFFPDMGRIPVPGEVAGAVSVGETDWDGGLVRLSAAMKGSWFRDTARVDDENETQSTVAVALPPVKHPRAVE